ncbi:MAG: carbohydrate kinase [Chloroflexi bacterium]|uniref:xylulokinase n=1 Tax=Candidatus Flexifilum breve TaxID=3140694 RepID=UPI003136852F|nr:carbohydrate kinase [Chloroflexota bacterium]
MKYFLGIDVGTSSLKTGLWREDGELAANASRPYPTVRLAPSWAEQDPLDWWRALTETVAQVLNKSGVRPAEIAGIGVDSMGWTFVPVDKAGEPLYSALTWQDRRAKEEAAALRAHPQADQLVHLNANPLDEAYSTAKVQWLKQYHPDIYAGADQLLIASSFLVRKLTDVNTCDYTQAYAFHCFDEWNLRWDEAAADLIGLDLAKLPPLYQSCAVVGEVTTRAAAELGLIAGIPVIAGGLDAAVGAFGNGVTRVGQTADQGGTAFGMSIAVDQVVVEPRLIFSPHVVPGLYLLQGGTVGGGTFEWFRAQLGQAEQLAAEITSENVFSIMTAEAERAPAGANGLIFLPYMSGERSPIWDSDARGVFIGLNFSTKRSDIIRALMEGCALAVYHNMQVAEESGAPVLEWIGIGGGANSPSWCQLKADITNRTFTVNRRANGEAGDNSLGVAVMAGYGVGHYGNLAQTIEQFLPRRQVYQPNPKNHAVYQELYPIYLNAYEPLKPTFTALAAFTQKAKEQTS